VPYQLNPHFLFNTLNAISAMIVTRRNDEAELMTDKLSSFLRASLTSDPTELVPLDQELTLMEDYLEIESIRFGERLHVEIDCASDACGVPVPSFLLQPLVENAIKYGVAPSLEPVNIRVTGRREQGELVVTVEDDGRAAANAITSAGTGVGLQNVRRRLAALYGDSGTVTAGRREQGYAAVIRLPVTPPTSR
jgi:LytS/YehU family sensor histidine kinase